jgi:alcohol dehydrogenase, propanol-preferring
MFLAFAAQHHLAVTSPEYPIGRADDALSDLSEGRIAGAAVLLA